MFESLLFTMGTLLLGWLAFGAIYQFIGAFAGLFYKNETVGANLLDPSLPMIRVFIPAYREDAIILNTVRQVMVSNYSNKQFEVLVIADGLRADTVKSLHNAGAKVLEVQFEKSTKSKALNSALNIPLERHYDIAVVLDADNAPSPDFFMRVAMRFNKGTKALQGRRVHKPSDATLALLDAASEDANNHILCRGARALGFSARLAGSGMAFEYDLFATAMADIDAIGGFDKALEGTLIRQGICIEYDELAIVFDEKVSNASAFSRQRGRWIAAQFHYCSQFLPQATKALFLHGNLDFFVKALQMALPPRLLAPGILAIGAVVSGMAGSSLAFWWLFFFLLNMLVFALALPFWIFQKQYWKVWMNIPRVFFAALWALFQIPKARRVFMVTPKTGTH